MILSVLITTTKETKSKLDHLLSILLPQMKGLDGLMEVYIEGEPKMQMGEKLNSLLKDAAGKYVWFLNDTDLISETAISDIFKAAESSPDIIGISGMTTTNDLSPYDWKVSIESDNKLILNSPIKRALVKKFRNRSVKAVDVWLEDMLNISPFVLESVIEKPIIHKRIEFKKYIQAGN